MNEKIFNLFMITLISKNYHLEIKELQKLIEQHRVWEYVDLNESKSKLIIENYSDVSNYLISMKSGISERRELTSKKRIRMTRDITELTNNQRSNLQQKQLIWSMREKLIRRTERDIQTIHLTVKASARQYILSSEMRSSIRQILQTLADRYKQSNVKIVELLHEQYHALKIPFVKTKIEQWISEWENFRSEMIIQGFKNTFGNDVIFVHEFLRSGIAINSMIRTIQTSQETSINKRLEDWIINQGITWDWSAKNTFEQNGTSKRYEALLIEKARCIREHVKLPKELFPECYMTAEHLMNRTSNQALNWKSPLIRMQKLINQSIRPEIEHLKMYECKAYSLLKEANVSPRDSKVKPRAFVDYLVDYNSTNIFRVKNNNLSSNLNFWNNHLNCNSNTFLSSIIVSEFFFCIFWYQECLLLEHDHRLTWQ